MNLVLLSLRSSHARCVSSWIGQCLSQQAASAVLSRLLEALQEPSRLPPHDLETEMMRGINQSGDAFVRKKILLNTLRDKALREHTYSACGSETAKVRRCCVKCAGYSAAGESSLPVCISPGDLHINLPGELHP